MKSIINTFKKYTDFDGRASRREYWLFLLFYAIVSILVILTRIPFFITSLVTRIPSPVSLLPLFNALGLLSLLVLVASIIPFMAVTIRRLHDIDRTGYWYFIRCVPLIGDIWFLILTLRAGYPDANQWGPNPLTAPTLVSEPSQEDPITP